VRQSPREWAATMAQWEEAMLRSKLSICAVGLALGAWANQSAHATFIQTSDPRFGLHSGVLDTITGLEWLNLTFSQGLSANQVLAQLGGDGTFSGFRYATTSEFSGLVNEVFGRPDICCFIDLPLNTTVNFIDLFGSTVPDSAQQYGMLPISTDLVLLTHFFVEPNAPGTALVGAYDQDTNSFDFRHPQRGSYLARAETTNVPDPESPVPEPASLVLLGAGLTALMATKRCSRGGQ
jgi:hypothetical protein